MHLQSTLHGGRAAQLCIAHRRHRTLANTSPTATTGNKHRAAATAHSGVRAHRAARCNASPTLVASASLAQAEDKWIARNVAPLADGAPAEGLTQLRADCSHALSTLRMPTTRNEEYRFTDISSLTRSSLTAAPANAQVDTALIDSLVFPECSSSTAVMVDGVFRPELSRLDGLPAGIYVGSVGGAPPSAANQLGSLSNAYGGPFAVLNGAMAADALAVIASPGASLSAPLFILHIATAGTAAGAADAAPTRSVAAPRLLLVAGEGSAVELIEEYVDNSSTTSTSSSSSSSSSHFTCAVAELLLEEGASVKHGYVQREAASGAVHLKATLVSQAAESSYSLAESCTGAGLARHDVGIRQQGADTQTTMRHFLLCGARQLHDLHTKLHLDHPRGEANQLHKCIVSHASGRGVFDGNVKVNRYAQKTDAGQLSRNLLLVPRATVNVKPNLQIIADDVKCTHGCAISDLSAEELFYFRARGISAEAARQALVYSFGAEVVQQLGYKALMERVQRDVVAALKDVAEDFAHAAAAADADA